MSDTERDLEFELTDEFASLITDLHDSEINGEIGSSTVYGAQKLAIRGTGISPQGTGWRHSATRPAGSATKQCTFTRTASSRKSTCGRIPATSQPIRRRFRAAQMVSPANVR